MVELGKVENQAGCSILVKFQVAHAGSPANRELQ
jgi:hypothetical protein